MWSIGLTGGIGSGKSSVANWLKEHDIPVLDADRIVHDLLAEDQDTIAAVVSAFGRDIMNAAGKIDRRLLGNIVFSDAVARKQLEEIIHPRVKCKMQALKADLTEKGHRLCVWDVPLLFESGFDKNVDEVWVVWVPLHTQLERVMNRDGLTEEQVNMRINAQMPLQDKISKAQFVLDNSGSWSLTEKQLRDQLSRISNYATE